MAIEETFAAAYEEELENAIARADALEARRALVSTACNLVCDEKGAEVLLEAGLIQALLPWLPP